MPWRAIRTDNLGVYPVEGESVRAMQLPGIVMIAGGILALVYGGVTYAKETHETKTGEAAHANTTTFGPSQRT